MNRLATSALNATALLCIAATATLAQDTLPSYKADPDVYRLVFEDQNFRVIDVLRKKGARDKPHSHTVASVIYNITDCTGRQYAPDGKTTQGTSKAGTAGAVTLVASHSVENIGSADCHQIIVERK